MKVSVAQNGFYWILIKQEGYEPEVAEFIDGQWHLVGSKKSYSPEHYDIELLSERLTLTPYPGPFRTLQ